MKKKLEYQEAQKILWEAVHPVGTETVPLEDCRGRILAEDVTAAADVPAFARSPYDGYAFRAEDIASASPEHPVMLQIVEEIAAGGISRIPVTKGKAVRVMTGAPLPKGADTVEKFENTVPAEMSVAFFRSAEAGSNVIRTGEDVRAGMRLASAGERIDTGMLGILAAQNQVTPRVFRIPSAGLLSTGSELVEPGDTPGPGKILNTNRYTIGSAVEECGCRMHYGGIVGDDAEKLAAAVRQIMEQADALIMTGGVSVGRYDYTRYAMEKAGVRILFDGVDFKPGMSCVYGMLHGKPVMGLSGNPAAALTNFHVIAAPALRKLCGVRNYVPKKTVLTLKDGFFKKSPVTRFLRGTLDLSEGKACIRLSEHQGNIVLRSTAGITAMAVVPAGSGMLEAGTVLEGFLL